MSEPVHTLVRGGGADARTAPPHSVEHDPRPLFDPAPLIGAKAAPRVRSALRIDCHQHLWPPRFIEALRDRTASPRLVDGWTLHTDGEAPYCVDPVAHDVDARRAREVVEGKAEVLVSLSSPLGIEHLPRAEAAALIAVWHETAIALGDPFRVWAATPVAEFDLAALRNILRHDRIVGLQLPATCLGDPGAILRMKPVLDELERAGKPLLVHPGPAAPGADGAPDWWPALVPYIAQLQSAWFAWHHAGRQQHPALRIAFVALAGLAPLQHERLVARGGAFGSVDPHVFYETSSYDTRAIDALVRVVGVDPIVHGSDRPYAMPRDPALGHAFTHALFTANPRALLTGEPR